MRQALEACHRGWGQSIIIGVAPARRRDRHAALPARTGRVWKGTAFGGARGRTDVPKIVDWYMDKKIEIDPMITHTHAARRHQQGLRSHARRQEHPQRGVVLEFAGLSEMKRVFKWAGLRRPVGLPSPILAAGDGVWPAAQHGAGAPRARSSSPRFRKPWKWCGTERPCRISLPRPQMISTSRSVSSTPRTVFGRWNCSDAPGQGRL